MTRRKMKQRQETVATTPLGEAIMFRDAEYGALVVETAPRGLVSFDFGFMREDAQAAQAVLSRYARSEAVGDETRWALDPDAHGLAVLSTLKQEMRLRRYLPDKLAERAIVNIKPGEMRRPDLPAAGKVIVHDAVEAGIKQRLGLTVAALHEKVSAPSLRYYTRPNAENLGAVRPPFAVARFFVESQKAADALREAVLNALGDWREHLVKLAVVAEGGGKLAVEMGLAIPAKLCESFLDAAIPTFQYSNIIGARLVDFDMSHALSEEERTDIEALGRTCSGCVRIQQEGARLVAHVPSNIPGHYGADLALHERLAWLHRVLEPWGPNLRDIGPLVEVDMTHQARPAELREEGGESLDEYKKMTGAQRTAMAKARKKLATNPEHQRELLQRRKDWKKDRGAQKRAAVWRKRTAAYRKESLSEGFAFVEWKEGGRYFGRNFREEELEKLIDQLRKRGVRVVTIDDKTTSLDDADIPYEESIEECGDDMHDHSGDDAANMVNGDVVATLATRFAKMPPAWWSTPQGEDALRKAKALIKDEHGEDAAKRFEKQLELLKLTSAPTMKAEAADASLGRTMLKAAGTFVPAASATMDGSDDEEEKGISADPLDGDDDGPAEDEDGDGEEDEENDDEDEGVDESRSSRPFVLVTERIGSALGQALRSSPAKPRETRQDPKGTALYFESEREANVFMASLTKLGFAYGDDFAYEKRPCGVEYVVALPEGVQEDFAAYLGEPGRGSNKSQYLLTGRGTNQKMVAAKARTNLHRLNPATVVTLDVEPGPLPMRVDGTRAALTKATGGKVVDTEDNQFGGVEDAPRVGALAEASGATVEVFLAILGGVLTQYDQRISAGEAKRGRVNIYRLGLLMKSLGFVRQDMKSRLVKDDEESLKALLDSMGQHFTRDPLHGEFGIPGINKWVVNQIQAWLTEKKKPKYPISKAALGAGGEAQA